MDTLCHKNARHKREYRHQIARYAGPVSRKKMRAHQHDIARLRVGKHFVPAAVGIGVLQSAGHDDKRGHQKRIRHLPARLLGKGTHLAHSSFFVFLHGILYTLSTKVAIGKRALPPDSKHWVAAISLHLCAAPRHHASFVNSSQRTPPYLVALFRSFCLHYSAPCAIIRLYIKSPPQDIVLCPIEGRSKKRREEP